MKINIAATEKINTAIRDAEGRATARTLTVEDMQEEINRAEKQLVKMLIPKKSWEGTTVKICPEKVANSYKSRADGTYAVITRCSSGWFLSDVYRERTDSRSHGAGKSAYLELSEKTRAAIPTTIKL